MQTIYYIYVMREIQISRKNKIREDGKIINIKTGEEFIPAKDRDGYYKIMYFGKCKLVHRLVAELFIPNPNNLPCVDHKNHDRTDNRKENLRWVTQKQNANNRIKHSKNPRAKKNAEYMAKYIKEHPDYYADFKRKQNIRNKKARKNNLRT